MSYHRIGSQGEKVWGKKAAGILFTDGKSMLLLKRAGEGDNIGKWALPGGKAKDKESDIQTARRESMEETGVKSIPGYRIDSLITKNGQQKFTGFVFRVDKPFDVELSKEHSEYKWAPLDEVAKMELHPKFKEKLPEYLGIIRRKVKTFSEWCSITKLMQL